MPVTPVVPVKKPTLARQIAAKKIVKPKPVVKPAVPIKPISGTPIGAGPALNSPGIPGNKYLNSRGENRWSNQQMARMNKKYKFKQISRSRGRAVKGKGGPELWQQ